MLNSKVRDSEGFYVLPTDILDLISLLLPAKLTEKKAQLLKNLLNEQPAQALMVEQLDFLSERQASAILAAIELGRRCWQAPVKQMDIIDSPQKVYAALSEDFKGKSSEHFAVLFLDVKNRLLDKTVVSIGAWTETIVPIPEILRLALNKRSIRIIVSHNHPSGHCDPSPQDLDITKQLGKACKLIGISLLDHIVFTDNDFKSLRQEKVLPEDTWN